MKEFSHTVDTTGRKGKKKETVDFSIHILAIQSIKIREVRDYLVV